MTPAIPPELWDEIIDKLHDNRSTLCKCSLVCRLWRWSSRCHLFYTLALTPLDIDTTLSLLCAPSSTIPPHVRALMIEDAAVYQRDLPRVINALSKLPQSSAVEKLSFLYTEWHVFTPEVKECLFTISHCLKSLTLEGMAFDTLGQALQLISSAPSLESLSVDGVDFLSKDTSFTEFRAPPIRHITFRWCREAPVITDWLCHWQPIPRVRNLTLDGMNVTGVPSESVSAYIRRLGPALEHLEVRRYVLDSGETQAALYKEIDLTHSTSLKTISFDNVILYDDPVGWRTYHSIILILSRITSRLIERVILVIDVNTERELDFFNLHALAALFAHGNPTFSELSTRLQFAIYGRIDRKKARAAIAEGLRELDSQGRLEFG